MINSDGSSEFVATINKGQTFVAGCNSSSMPDFPHDENIPAKQLHVLKYIGITEKNGTDYHGFVHQGGYVTDDMDCKFPEMIQYSVGVEFDINMENHYYGEVWDHDWDSRKKKIQFPVTKSQMNPKNSLIVHLIPKKSR